MADFPVIVPAASHQADNRCVEVEGLVEEYGKFLATIQQDNTHSGGVVPTDCAFNMKSTNHDFLPLSPRKLISLWDMIQFPATPLLRALTDLNYLKETFSSAYDRSDPRNPETWPDRSKQFTNIIEFIGKTAKELELTETQGRCVRFCEIVTASTTELLPGTGIYKKLTAPEVLLELEGIEKTLGKELSDRQFVHVPALKLKFCEQPALFGESVNKAFPSAVKDIMEAGNCLAADLNTATVFHLMRVVECGMRALAVHLKVKIKDRSIKQAGWDQLIKLMEKEIYLRREKYDKNKRRKRKDLETCKFYTVMVDELNIFKEIWRDNVMHTGSPYNEAEALGVFTRVRDFMQRLSTKVSETNN